MANAGTCCLRNAWDLSFLDGDSVRLGPFGCFSGQQKEATCTSWRNGQLCSAAAATKNPLALVVRRRPVHTYSEISPLEDSPQEDISPPAIAVHSGSPLESGELPVYANTGSLAVADSDLSNHVYQNSSAVDRVYQNLAASCAGLVDPEDDEALTSPRFGSTSSGGSCSSSGGGGGGSTRAGQSRQGTTCCRSCHSSSSSLSPQLKRAAAAAGAAATRDRVPSTSSTVPSSVDLCLRPPALTCRTSISPGADDVAVFFHKDEPRSPTVGRDVTFRPMSKDLHRLSRCRLTKLFGAWDNDRLAKTFHRLELCNFYLGSVSFNDAKVLLRQFPVGTFLLRDSSDDRYPFSLSVQTSRGTTSIRIVYECGLFRLDSEPDQVHVMPAFDCVLRLIQFYVQQSLGHQHTNSQGSRSPSNFVLLDMNGQRDMPVLLRRPVEFRAPSLAHLCRKRINGILGKHSVNRLQLLPSLKEFLTDYPYDV